MASDKQNVGMARVELVLQRFPGTVGSSADRAVPSVDFKVTIGKKVSKGKSDADGKIVIIMPAKAKALLEMLGTTYVVTPVKTLERSDTTHGIQRRLQSLGYSLGQVDGSVGPRTGDATLQFQADNAPLKTLGKHDADFMNKLHGKAGL